MTYWNVLFAASLLAGVTFAAPIEPTWESLAANYQVPQWFMDGKIGVWMHWGIPSAADENRPNDGSHYARRMYSVVPDDYTGKMGMSQILTKWHTERYGHPSEFGYEDRPRRLNHTLRRAYSPGVRCQAGDTSR